MRAPVECDRQVAAAGGGRGLLAAGMGPGGVGDAAQERDEVGPGHVLAHRPGGAGAVEQLPAEGLQPTGGSFDALASTGGAVVAYLDGYQGQWNDARAASSFAARTENIDDVGFAGAMISKLRSSHQIDSSKVYAAGFSNGGQMVIRLVHQAPGLLAGAAIIAATQPAPDNFLLASAPSVPLPVMLIHGTRDPIAPYDGGAMSWWARRFFRVGGVSLSAPQTAAYFAARNAIIQPPPRRISRTAENQGKTSVTRMDYQQDGKLPVTLYTVHAGATLSQDRVRPRSSWAGQPMS